MRFGLKNYSLTRAAVHHDADRFRKLQVADTALLSHSRLFRQPLPIDRAFARVGIHGEVSDAKGSEILEEMAALGRFFREQGLYTIVRWNSFYTNPPLCINQDQLREAFAIIDKGLEITDKAVKD